MLRPAVFMVSLCCSTIAAAALEQCPLRVAFVQGNLAQGAMNKSGEYRGVSMDIAKDLARRWQRPIETQMLTPTKILEGIARGEIDLGFVAPNPDRMGTVSYSQTYMMVQQTAVVRASSPLKSVSALDRPGERIGVSAGDSVAGYLKRTLAHATVLESADQSMAEAIAWLRDGTVTAFAGNRQRLGVTIRGLQDLQLLPDNLYGVPQAIAISRSEPNLLAELDDVLTAMRASGFLSRAVRRSRADGISVAVGRLDLVGRSSSERSIGPKCPLRTGMR